MPPMSSWNAIGARLYSPVNGSAVIADGFSPSREDEPRDRGRGNAERWHPEHGAQERSPAAEARCSEESARVTQVAELHRHAPPGATMPCLAQPDESEEEPDTNREAVLQARRDGVGEPRADVQERDREEHRAADEHRAEAHCQPIPSAARPNAMNAFSPMYGATARGRFA